MSETAITFEQWQQEVNEAIGIPHFGHCGGCDEDFLREKFEDGTPPKVFAYFLLETIMRRRQQRKHPHPLTPCKAGRKDGQA